MTIEEAREHKELLEGNIKGLIKEFSRDTGLFVEEVYLIPEDFGYLLEDGRAKVVEKIEVVVRF